MALVTYVDLLHKLNDEYPCSKYMMKKLMPIRCKCANMYSPNPYNLIGPAHKFLYCDKCDNHRQTQHSNVSPIKIACESCSVLLSNYNIQNHCMICDGYYCNLCRHSVYCLMYGRTNRKSNKDKYFQQIQYLNSQCLAISAEMDTIAKLDELFKSIKHSSVCYHEFNNGSTLFGEHIKPAFNIRYCNVCGITQCTLCYENSICQLSTNWSNNREFFLQFDNELKKFNEHVESYLDIGPKPAGRN